MSLDEMEFGVVMMVVIAKKPGGPYFDPTDFRLRLENVVKEYSFLEKHLFFMSDIGTIHRTTLGLGDLYARQNGSPFYDWIARLYFHQRGDRLEMTDVAQSFIPKWLQPYDASTIKELDELAAVVWSNKKKLPNVPDLKVPDLKFS